MRNCEIFTESLVYAIFKEENTFTGAELQKKVEISCFWRVVEICSNVAVLKVYLNTADIFKRYVLSLRCSYQRVS